MTSKTKTKTKTKEQMRYSPAEQIILDIIQKNGGRITTKELIAKRYAGKRVPFNAASNVRATLRTLDLKIKYNKEPFVLKREGQVGPHPQEIWMEKC